MLSLNRNQASKKILITGSASLEEMLRKGNVWYIRRYEEYFDRVYVAYVFGRPHEPVVNGNTILVSLAGRRGGRINILLAPYRIYRFARRIRPTVYLNSDLVYSWWTCGLAKALLRARVCLLPVCIPEELYAATGRSMSGLPIWLERVFTRLSFSSAHKILAGRNDGYFTHWLASHPWAEKKLVVVDTVVDAISTDRFFETLQAMREDTPRRTCPDDGFVLVFVGRLHKEKLVDHLVRMMATLKKWDRTSRLPALRLIGDGGEKQRLKRLASQLGVEASIEFVGSVPNEDLPKHLLRAKAFVSTLTGSSLREAALCGLPIVAYNADWIRGLLKHEQTAMLAPFGDFEGLARCVLRLMNDEELRERLSQNIRKLAWELWSPQAVAASLRQAYEDF